MALVLPVQPSSTMGWKGVQYLQMERPWLSLYGTRIRPVSPVGSLSSNPPVDPALIHRALPDELLYEVFAHMAPYTLGRAACVCRKWQYGTRSPALWRNACMKTWQTSGAEENERIVWSCYGGSWRRMWRDRPRLRFDGLYVSRNTYIRAGISEWKVTNPVHLVCYYRYTRFYPSGRFLYKVSSSKLKEVAPSLHGRVSKPDAVYNGCYIVSHDQVKAAILYPGLRPTVLRIQFRIRGTVPGANNRLDMVSLVTSGLNEAEVNCHAEELLRTVEDWEENETHNPDVPAVSHRRGLSSLVFVPFEEVETSELNLPVERMDFFVPG
eukprot:c23938_g1_i2 orf=166-1137(+)